MPATKYPQHCVLVCHYLNRRPGRLSACETGGVVSLHVDVDFGDQETCALKFTG